ncbi:Zinc finger BED domain-containing protein RICESLEEPER 3, partial [Bienertia sinuspersici]
QIGSSSLANTSKIHESVGKGCKKSRLRNDYVSKNGNMNAHDKKIELKKYLKDKIEPDDDNFEILDWWATQSNRYPIVMKMLLMSLLLERVDVFWILLCTSLTPRMVEGLICAQDWMRTSYEPISIEESLIELENME